MNFLFVDSCQNELFVLLYNNGKVSYRTSNGNKKHNSVLLPTIDELLNESGIKISEVQNIACRHKAWSDYLQRTCFCDGLQ